MGRDKFLEFMNTYASKSSRNIRRQIKRLGSNVAWGEFTYTLDRRYSDAVSEAFCRLFNQGYIKRRPDIVRWSPTLRSAVSDAEVKFRDVKPGTNKFTEKGREIVSDLFGLMFYIKYEVADGESVVVATSRPETMFADVALCVHPDDARYSHLIGQCAINPINNEQLLIYASTKIDPKFGSGVMKLTPSHNVMDQHICDQLGIK